jgi:hypothetical protein
MSAITAEPIPARRITLVPLRAEHADEMTIVLADPAARAVVGWLQRRSVRTVVAHIHPRRLASAAVASAAGLTPTGHWHDGEIRWCLTTP